MVPFAVTVPARGRADWRNAQSPIEQRVMPRHITCGRLTPAALDAFHAADADYFRELISSHQHRLRAYCRRWAVDRDEEDELVQATFVRAWENRATYAARGTIEGWFLTVARKLCHQALAERRKRVDIMWIADLVAPDPADSVAAHRLQDIEDDRLSLILKLSERRLMVTVERLAFGRSVAQTASALELRPGTVKATLHQATKWLAPHRETIRQAEDCHW